MGVVALRGQWTGFLGLDERSNSEPICEDFAELKRNVARAFPEAASLKLAKAG